MLSDDTAALVVAHPGHEVRVHGWLEREKPLVFVLTDGAGLEGEPRIDSTAEYLKRFGLKSGRVFARFTDTEVYRLVIARDFDPFLRLSEELAESFVEARVGRVAGDAAEGYTPSHDVVRLVTNAAVAVASRASGRPIANYDFTLVGRPDHCPEHLRAEALWLRLDEGEFTRKMAAAFEFHPEVAAETREMLEGGGDKVVVDYFKLGEDEHAATELSGLDVFRVECLRPVREGAGRFDAERPFYERRGEEKSVLGLYDRVIRYCEHMRPLADALAEHAARSA
ncbi:MAG TPA: hypothetical protein VM914_11050 [Pyrinomonadaceae bacterium]|jgi:hypothetical protein|nr:hypothetical protein [Pyrinomonadaceae bacterium]